MEFFLIASLVIISCSVIGVLFFNIKKVKRQKPVNFGKDQVILKPGITVTADNCMAIAMEYALYDANTDIRLNISSNEFVEVSAYRKPKYIQEIKKNVRK